MCGTRSPHREVRRLGSVLAQGSDHRAVKRVATHLVRVRVRVRVRVGVRVRVRCRVRLEGVGGGGGGNLSRVAVLDDLGERLSRGVSLEGCRVGVRLSVRVRVRRRRVSSRACLGSASPGFEACVAYEDDPSVARTAARPRPTWSGLG